MAETKRPEHYCTWKPGDDFPCAAPLCEHGLRGFELHTLSEYGTGKGRILRYVRFKHSMDDGTTWFTWQEAPGGR